ncbi:MAG: outer membrane protein [Sphingobacteriales bacterium]
MKKLLIATTLLASTTLANAADIARPVNPPILDTWSWSGFYVGTMWGGGWDSTSNDLNGYGYQVSAPTNGKGVLAGIYGGYNQQFANWVVGLETDIAWSNIKGSTSMGGHLDTDNGSVPWAVEGSNKLKWLGTTRARLGYAFGHFMPYATAGVAYGGTSIDGVGVLGSSSVNASFAEHFSASNTRVGWAAGGGLEYAMGQMLMRMEYLHYDLGTSKYAMGDPNITLSTHHRGDTVKVGAGFKF